MASATGPRCPAPCCLRPRLGRALHYRPTFEFPHDGRDAGATQPTIDISIVRVAKTSIADDPRHREDLLTMISRVSCVRTETRAPGGSSNNNNSANKQSGEVESLLGPQIRKEVNENQSKTAREDQTRRDDDVGLVGVALAMLTSARPSVLSGPSSFTLC